MEFAPESFGQVIMLYIDCTVNGHPVKAFVDSGTINTFLHIENFIAVTVIGEGSRFLFALNNSATYSQQIFNCCIFSNEKLRTPFLPKWTLLLTLTLFFQAPR